MGVMGCGYGIEGDEYAEVRREERREGLDRRVIDCWLD